MQRVRMSLPYFKDYNWDVEVVVVHEKFSDTSKDPLLLKCLPNELLIHKVEAFSKNITAKFGLGSLALRSMYFYKKYVDELLKAKKFDLIYFSTTEFAITILGAHWKKKFQIPYVIDMQDPWHTEYYQNKPKSERPKKYWFSYRLNKYLEPIAMKSVDGLISVSEGYIVDLKERYKELANVPCSTITFGAYKPDFDFVNANSNLFSLPYQIEQNAINMVYVGRGGYDMKTAATLLFKAFDLGLKKNFDQFKNVRFHFIGTSYAPKNQGKPTIKPIADELGLSEYVHEQTDRVSYYNGIFALTQANALVILGSNESNYTASKIYPYILAKKPILAIFHPDSSASKIINGSEACVLISIKEKENTITEIYNVLNDLCNGNIETKLNEAYFKAFEASNMTKLQCNLFNEIVTN